MFRGASTLNASENVNKWDVTAVEDMHDIFRGVYITLIYVASAGCTVRQQPMPDFSLPRNPAVR